MTTTIPAASAETATPAPVPGGIRGSAPVHDLLYSMETKLRWALLGNILQAAALSLFAAGYVWQVAHPPQPEYFATTADGKIIPLVPVSEPYIPQEALLAWVSGAVAQAYTLDHVHARDQLSRMRDLFTLKGFESHRRALEDAGLWEAVEKRRLITQVDVSTGVVINQGILGGRYVWKLEVPMKISYQGASGISLPQNNIAEVLVVRVPTGELARGYAIHQLVTRPHEGGGR